MKLFEPAGRMKYSAALPVIKRDPADPDKVSGYPAFVFSRSLKVFEMTHQL